MPADHPVRLLIIAYYFPPVHVVGAVRLYHLYRESRKYAAGIHVLSTRNRRLMATDGSLRPGDAAVTELPTLDLRRLTLRPGARPHLSTRVKERLLVHWFARLTDSFPFNLLWGDGGLLYILAGYRAGARLVRDQGITHLFSSFRPYSDHAIAALLKRRFPGLVWVADFRDLHADPVRRNVLWPAFQRWCNRRLLRRADVVTTVSEGLAAQLRPLHPRVVVLRNGIGHYPAGEPPPTPPGAFLITYTGSLYPGLQDAAPLLRALRELIRDGAVGAGTVCLAVAGKDGPLWRQWAAAGGLEAQLLDLGPLPYPAALALQRKSCLNLLLSWTRNGAAGILTGKLYEYLDAGRPVLALVNGPADPELGAILADTGAGRLFADTPADGPALKAWLLDLYRHWQRTGQAAAGASPEKLRPYRWETQMNAFWKDVLFS